MGEAKEHEPVVLIATIGERDPLGQHPAGKPAPPPSPAELRPTGPLLAARRHRPDRVFLLFTHGVAAQAAETRDAVRRELPSATVETVPLAPGNPAFFDEALAMADGALAGIRGELPEGARIVVCPSSGTPQLGHALIAAASVLFPGAEFLQALDPRHVRNEDERLRPFDPRITRLRTDIDRAFRELERFNWKVAADILRELLSVRSGYLEGPRRKALEAARGLAEAMGKADDFDLEGARKAAEPSGNGGFRRDLDRLEQWFGWAASQQSQNAHVLPSELTAAAARSATAGVLTRALVTAVTAWEVAIRARLKSACGFDPDNIGLRDRKRLPEELRARLREADGGRRWRLEGERNRREALVAFDERTAAVGQGSLEQLAGLARLRNDLVHTGSVRHDEAVAALEEALGAIASLFQAWGWPDWREAPTAPEPLRDLIRKVRSAAEQHPGRAPAAEQP